MDVKRGSFEPISARLCSVVLIYILESGVSAHCSFSFFFFFSSSPPIPPQIIDLLIHTVFCGSLKIYNHSSHLKKYILKALQILREESKLCETQYLPIRMVMVGMTRFIICYLCCWREETHLHLDQSYACTRV